MLEQEATLGIGLRPVVVAATATATWAATCPAATATTATTAGVVWLTPWARRDLGINNRLTLSVHDDAGEFEARAEQDVGDFGALVVDRGCRVAGAVFVALRRRRYAPIAGRDVGEAVVTIVVGRLRWQQRLAIPLETHPVVAVRLQLHCGRWDAVATEVGDSADQLATVGDDQFAEVELAADLAEVAVKLRRRVRAVHDQQIDAQIAKGLPLEGETAIAVGLHRLGYAARTITAAALAAAAEVEPYLGASHRRAVAVDDPPAQGQFRAFVGAEGLDFDFLSLGLRRERLADGEVRVLRARLDHDFIGLAPASDRKGVAGEEVGHQEHSGGGDQGGQYQDDDDGLAHGHSGRADERALLRLTSLRPHSRPL